MTGDARGSEGPCRLCIRTQRSKRTAWKLGEPHGEGMTGRGQEEKREGRLPFY